MRYLLAATAAALCLLVGEASAQSCGPEGPDPSHPQYNDLRGVCCFNGEQSAQGDGTGSCERFDSSRGSLGCVGFKPVKYGNVWINGQWTSHTCIPSGQTDARGRELGGDDKDIPDEKFYSGRLPTNITIRKDRGPNDQGYLSMQFPGVDPQLHSCIKDNGTIDIRIESGAGFYNGKRIHLARTGFRTINSAPNIGYFWEDLEEGDIVEISLKGILRNCGDSQECPNLGEWRHFNYNGNRSSYPHAGAYQECRNGNQRILHAFFPASSECQNVGKAGLKCYFEVAVSE